MYNIDKEKFGAFIYELRKEKGYTQEEMAKKLFISNKAISKWETGQSIPDTMLLIPLSELLEVSVTELLKCQRLSVKEEIAMDETESMVKTVIEKKEEENFKYIIKVMAWYLLCPLVGLALFVIGNDSLIHGYLGATMMVSMICLASDFQYKITWWDPSAMRLQEEVRKETKERRGKYYIRPALLGLPAMLAVLVIYLGSMI